MKRVEAISLSRLIEPHDGYHLEVFPDKTAKSAQCFLDHVVAKAPFYIKKLLTDNGEEFTDHYISNGEREPTGNHVFDQMCAKHSIEHRLTKPAHPQTNGMVERLMVGSVRL